MATESWRLGFIIDGRVEFHEISGLTCVGGDDSQGIRLKGLRSKEDYAFILPHSRSVVLQPCKGLRRSEVQMEPSKIFKVNDLSLFLVPVESELIRGQSNIVKGESRFAQDMKYLLSKLKRTDSVEVPLRQIVDLLLKVFDLDRGLIVARVPGKDQLEKCLDIKVETGLLSEEQDWYSETLFKEVFKTQSIVRVNNIFGSGYDQSKSLMATGFVSLVAWPLELRGDTVGVLVLGSSRAHAGLSEIEESFVSAYCQLASLMLSFYSADERSVYSKDVQKSVTVESERDWLGGVDLEDAKMKFVFNKVETALALNNGNRSKAAKDLGVTPRTLFRYLEQLR